MRVNGCDLHAGNLALWSGSQVEVWTFEDGGGSPGGQPPSRVSQFEAKAFSVGIRDESLFICGALGVYVANFTGNHIAIT